MLKDELPILSLHPLEKKPQNYTIDAQFSILKDPGARTHGK